MERDPICPNCGEWIQPGVGHSCTNAPDKADLHRRILAQLRHWHARYRHDENDWAEIVGMELVDFDVGMGIINDLVGKELDLRDLIREVEGMIEQEGESNAAAAVVPERGLRDPARQGDVGKAGWLGRAGLAVRSLYRACRAYLFHD